MGRAGRSLDLLGDRDKVSVFHFANGVARVQGFTTDRGLAKAAINRLDRNGGAVGDGSQTALFDAIIEAAGYSTNAVGRRALVVMTDGQNNTGTSSSQSAINAAVAAGLPAFTIGFGNASVSVLQDIASGTGGLFFFGANSSDLQTILRAIGRTLGNQYILSWLTGFVSGGTERIEVRVADGSNQDQKSTTYSQATTGCQRPSTCTVRVLSPNGGEVWTKGTQQTVRWSTSGPACGGIGVGVFNGGDVWPLADLTANDGTETFNIDFLPLGSDYQVVVTDRATNVTSSIDASDGIFRIDTPATGRLACAQNAETLCLRRGRFQVRVVWGTTSALSGVAKAIPLTRDSGAFYFFDSQNPELVVKVLDGRSVNSHFWFFSGALTSLPYSIFVTAFEINLPQPCRVLSGRYRVSVQANMNFPRAGQWAWLGRARQQEKPAVWRNPADGYATGCRDFKRLDGCVGGSPPDLSFKLRGRTATGGNPCSASATVLCFQGNRFKAELSFVDTRGKTVAAKAVSVSPISGYFWFLDANNPELALKLIDGRAANGSFWVFYGALTTVDYTLRVTDTTTGRVKTYENRQGRLVSVGDTQAFPGQ